MPSAPKPCPWWRKFVPKFLRRPLPEIDERSVNWQPYDDDPLAWMDETPMRDFHDDCGDRD